MSVLKMRVILSPLDGGSGRISDPPQAALFYIILLTLICKDKTVFPCQSNTIFLG